VSVDLRTRWLVAGVATSVLALSPNTSFSVPFLMTRKHKTGKQRLDRYYHLAKEHGYRSRAAFKLLQLNRRHGFLGRASRGVLDLCAAPGGWMQVCRQHMPVAAPCIGVDLVPIAPIRNCSSIVADITTEQCVRLVRDALIAFGKVLDPHGRAAEASTGVDVVLSDASPNMGAAWVQDAYNQAELTLHALRVASVFLHRGGWFVSKLFRSADSDAFLLVVRRLFRRVYVTKPPASRQQSAEIYVVCKDYTPPTKMDSTLLDPRRVFCDTPLPCEPSLMSAPASDHQQSRQMQHQERIVRRQLLSGRAEVMKDVNEAPTGSLVRRTCTLKAFLESPQPALVLSRHQALVIDEESVLPETARRLLNSEIRENCRDLGVCGPKDFRRLLKFHATVRRSLVAEEHGACSDAASSLSEKEQVTESAGSVSDLSTEPLRSASRIERRQARKAERKRARMLVRQKGRQTDPTVSEDGYGLTHTSLFSLDKAGKLRDLAVLESVENEVSEPSSGDENRNENTTAMAVDSDSTNESEDNASDTHDDDAGTDSADDDFESESSSGQEDEPDMIPGNESIVDSSSLANPLEAGARRWLARLGIPSLEALNAPDLTLAITDRGDNLVPDDVVADSSCSSSDTGSEADVRKDSDFLHDRPKRASGFTVGRILGKDISQTTELDPEMDERTRAELHTVASQYMLRHSGRQTLIDATYNRHAFDDPADLPKWFLEDEKRARHAPQLVGQAQIDATEAQLRASLEHLPKRVREARQRRQSRQQRSLETARKEVEAIARAPEASTGSKVREIARTMRRARGPRRQRPVLAVLRGNRAVPVDDRNRAPKSGRRTRYKLVDRRLKADLRARQKRRH
jgi:AdoMet-dependent rRNA methyltransferase SPB1